MFDKDKYKSALMDDLKEAAAPLMDARLFKERMSLTDEKAAMLAEAGKVFLEGIAEPLLKAIDQASTEQEAVAIEKAFLAALNSFDWSLSEPA